MTPYRGVDSPALATHGHGAKRGRKVGWVRLRGQGDTENGTRQGMQHEASVRPMYHVHVYAHHPHPLHPQRTVHCPSCTQPPKCHFADDAFLRVLLACLHVHNFRDWAAFSRRKTGAWSVARSPHPPPRTALRPKAPVRGALHQPADPVPDPVPPVRSPGTHLGPGVARGSPGLPQSQPQQLVRDPGLITCHAQGGHQHIAQPAHLATVMCPLRLVQAHITGGWPVRKEPG